MSSTPWRRASWFCKRSSSTNGYTPAAAELRELVAQGNAELAIAGRMRELATLLESHVRLEERRLFPLIETLLPEETLTALADTGTPRTVVRCGGRSRRS